MPGAVKVTVVADRVGSAKVTVPGPLTATHSVVIVEPVGRPSSLTPGETDKVAGKATVRCLEISSVGA